MSDTDHLDALVESVTKAFRTALTAHITDITCAASEDEGEAITVSVSVKLDVGSKVPHGTVTLSYARKTKESVEFALDDKDQGKLELEEEQ